MVKTLRLSPPKLKHPKILKPQNHELGKDNTDGSAINL